jgi:hypothetical protein
MTSVSGYSTAPTDAMQGISAEFQGYRMKYCDNIDACVKSISSCGAVLC